MRGGSRRGAISRFFRRHALYYLPKGELEELRDALDVEITRSTARRVPGLVSLDDEDQEDLDGWYDPELPRRLGLPQQIGDELARLFRRDRGRRSESAGEAASSRARGDRLINPKGSVGVVLVQLQRPSTDLEYAREVLTRGERLIEALRPAEHHPSLSAHVVGAYRSFREVNAVSRDGRLATGISVGLVLLLMLGFFRSPRGLLLAFGPLVVAASLTMAVTALAYGRLTVMTVFVLALLAGMGIDYGIHLYGRTLDELRAGQSLRVAVTLTLDDTGRALLAAAATSTVALLTLHVGHFEGFKEFGTVAAYGLLFCAATAMLLYAPLVAVAERLRPLRMPSSPASRFAAPARPAKGPASQSWRRAALVLFVGVMVVTAVLGYAARDAAFEYDFRNLRAPKSGLGIPYGGAVGRNASTTPAVLLGESEAQMRKVDALLRSRLGETGDGSLKSFITIATFLPSPEVQQARRQVIREIGDLAEEKVLDQLTGDKARIIADLRSMTKAEPFSVRDLPDWAVRLVSEQDGSVGRIGLLYARLRNWDARSVGRFQKRYGVLQVDGRHVLAASSKFILADVVRMVRADGLRLLVGGGIVLISILLLLTRSLLASMALALSIAIATAWTAGLMACFDVRLGLYNVIVIPVIIGVGIDGAIHLYHRYRSLRSLGPLLRTTGLTVTASSWTTAAGFVGLLFVAHKGLRTIGVLGGLGILVSWLAVMSALPFLLLLLDRFAGSPETTRTPAAD
jgi:predicted RND superfamily exporter protein